MVKENKMTHLQAQAIARQYGFDPMDEAFSRCVGAILEGQRIERSEIALEHPNFGKDIEVPRTKPPKNWKAYE